MASTRTLTPPGEGPSAGSEDANRKALARRWSVIALTALGLVGAGVVIGWFALARVLAPADAEPKVVEVPAAQFLGSPQGASTMPDVRGLAVDDARAVLADADIPTSAVTLEERPSALPEGVVAAQSPAFGTTPVDRVVLTVAAAATVPDLAGLSEAEAQDSLVALGTRVVVQRRFVAGTDPGKVVLTKPKAGAVLAESVTLVVSEPPGSVYLTQLDTVDGSRSCSGTEAVVNGTGYDTSLACKASDQAEDYTWLLAKKVESFESVLGVPDDGDRTTRIAVTVLLDGKKIGGGTAAFGKPVNIEARVRGGLQLQVRIRALSSSDSFSKEELILGDARLVGDKDLLAELAGWAGR